MKNGRVVIVLRGRFAGRKAVVVQTADKVPGSGRAFGRALGKIKKKDEKHQRMKNDL